MQEVNGRIYDVQKSIEAQRRYCEEKRYPHFAPRSGRCWRCGRNIYEQHQSERCNWISGIDVEKASSELITGCPHCNWSYCD